MANTFEWDAEKGCYKTIVEAGGTPTYFDVVGGKIYARPEEPFLNESNSYNTKTRISKQELYGSADVKSHEVMLEEIERANGD